MGISDVDRTLPSNRRLFHGRAVTLPKMAAAGDGGTTELLSWIVAMGAAGRRPAHTVCYKPALELRCGMGCVYWDMSEEER